MDGLHSWVLQRIKQGNQRDEAQTIADLIRFLEEEEARKIHGSIQRFFAISEILQEPRKGLTNAASLQNQLVRMVAFNENKDCLILTSIACTCSNCLVGLFERCTIHHHEIVHGKIAAAPAESTKKGDLKCKDEYQYEEADFRQYLHEWDQQWIEINAENKKNDSFDFSHAPGNQEGEFEHADLHQDRKSPRLVNSSPQLIQDDPLYWQREIDFNRHMALLFSHLRESTQINTILTSIETYDKMDLNEMKEVWNCINEDNSSDGNFHMGYIENILLKRSYFQECGSNEWFNIEMINVAFKNIQYRSQKKVLALRGEVINKLQVQT